jgi:hypothetical protein
MKSQRRAFLYVVSFLSIPIIYAGLLIALSIYFEPIEGDLTRLGNWAERDFGWIHQGPSVSLESNGETVRHPDVLVLGDSFARPNIWQSVAAQKRGIEILSFHYEQAGCLDNWLRWVAEKHYPTAKTVVIETVEREFMTHFAAVDACRRSTPSAFKVESGAVRPARKNFELTKDIWYFARVAENSVKLRTQAGRIESPRVVNVPLKTRDLFSNRMPDRLLYYKLDDAKQKWPMDQIVSAIANLKKIRDSLGDAGLRLIVIVVPDKSSVYRPYFAAREADAGNPDVYSALNEAHIPSVNLLDYFRGELRTTVDLYKPDDTHLSVQGFKAMGEKVADLF